MRHRRIAPILLFLALAACNDQGAGQSGPPPSAGPVEVGVVTLKSEPVQRHIELPGRVVAYATAEVRPQVDGIVRKIVFKEARRVAAGDVLYELDNRKFQAAVNAAKAEVDKAAAATVSAQQTYDRTAKLATTNAVSAQTLDDAQSTLLQAKASEEGARADLETAQINLDDATIKAPIDGVIGVSAVSVGSLVTANQTDALATIRQVDPIYVDLVDSSTNLLRIRDEVQSGQLGRQKGVAADVALTLDDDKPYSQQGKMTLAEMVVSQTSGTFSLRATFPNPDRILLPGMFVRAKVDLGTMPNAFLVPQRAVTRDDSGSAQLYVVSADGKAELRKVTTMGSSGNDWIVADGVKNGDRLIVDGFQKISAGSAVKPVEATIDDNGVVKQTIAPKEAANSEAGQ